MSSEERSSIANGIWLCEACAKLVDSDVVKFGSALLGKWRLDSERAAYSALDEGLSESIELLPQPVSALHSPIPAIGGLPYEVARSRLISVGWQPRLNHFSYRYSLELLNGNGQYFWARGFWEIRHSYGTGLANCIFDFRDVYGNALVVHTVGEVDEVTGHVAGVATWCFDRSRSL